MATSKQNITQLLLDFKQNHKLQVKLNSLRIHPSESLKYLGIYLDSTLSGKTHCTALSSKLRRANGILSKIRHYVPTDQLKSIYHAIFSSHLSYGAQVWGQNIDEKHIISKLQNRALRIMNYFEHPRSDANQLYKTSSILKIKDTVKMNNILFLHDYINDLLPGCYQNEFHLLGRAYTSNTIRNSMLGCPNISKKNTTPFGLNSISYQSISCWNSLIKLFKRNLALLPRQKLKARLKLYFLSHYRST